nr:diguanylate cyclase [Methylomarinum sp. Ch1-1]MDP4521548.1 diguanylate cyclase [Methylomarinum sp. Ch1-1]
MLERYKQALFGKRQLKINYEDLPEPVIFNPFGLVVRNSQYFFAGSYGDSQEPNLLPVNKLHALSLTESPALTPEADFDLEAFSETYLNHPVSPHLIKHLIVEFPEKSYFYVKSHPIRCKKFILSEPQGSPGYFNLEAFDVPNTIKLQRWLSGFHDDAQVLRPAFLRRQINRSYVDQLTNLYNRNAFDRLGQREVERYYRNNDCHFSLLVMDIDHFKTINDQHGHIFGDEVLVKVAECFRGYDAIRYGGEEFAVLLPETRAKQAHIAAERIRKNIERLSLKNDQRQPVPVTISIGIAEFPIHLSTSDRKILNAQKHSKSPHQSKSNLMTAITGQADKALYQAKGSGRNQSVIYQADLS